MPWIDSVLLYTEHLSKAKDVSNIYHLAIVASRSFAISQRVLSVEHCFWYNFQAQTKGVFKNVKTMHYPEYILRYDMRMK